MNTGRTHFKNGQIPWNKGKHHSEETKRKLSQSQKIRFSKTSVWNKGLKGYNKDYVRSKEWCKHISEAKKGHGTSDETREKIGRAFRGKPQTWNRGANHYAWRGGTTSHNSNLRKTSVYKLWRMNVFRKDGFMCVICGYKSKGKRPSDIHADHIKRFSDYPDLRYSVENGRTLCIPCHKKTETWGFNYHKQEVPTWTLKMD